MAIEGDFQPYQSSSSCSGSITQWVDDKGYGWVDSGGKRLFAHIKDFKRGQRRPKTGEEVRFVPGLDPKGRPCAKLLVFVEAGCDSGPRPQPGDDEVLGPVREVFGLGTGLGVRRSEHGLRRDAEATEDSTAEGESGDFEFWIRRRLRLCRDKFLDDETRIKMLTSNL